MIPLSFTKYTNCLDLGIFLTIFIVFICHDIVYKFTHNDLKGFRIVMQIKEILTYSLQLLDICKKIGGLNESFHNVFLEQIRRLYGQFHVCTALSGHNKLMCISHLLTGGKIKYLRICAA